MKKAAALILCIAMVVTMFTGCGKQGQVPAAANADIGAERAREIALTHAQAGLGGADVVMQKVEREFDDGRWIYDIEFRDQGIEYNYEIDAETGEIISYESERD